MFHIYHVAAQIYARIQTSGSRSTCDNHLDTDKCILARMSLCVDALRLSQLHFSHVDHIGTFSCLKPVLSRG